MTWLYTSCSDSLALGVPRAGPAWLHATEMEGAASSVLTLAAASHGAISTLMKSDEVW